MQMAEVLFPFCVCPSMFEAVAATWQGQPGATSPQQSQAFPSVCPRPDTSFLDVSTLVA